MNVAARALRCAATIAAGDRHRTSVMKLAAAHKQCFLLLLARAPNARTHAMGRPARGLRGRTPALVAWCCGFEEGSISIRGRLLAKLAAAMPPFCAAQMSHAFRSGGVGARATAQDIVKPSHASRFTWPCQSAEAADAIRSVHPHAGRRPFCGTPAARSLKRGGNPAERWKPGIEFDAFSLVFSTP